MEGKAPVRRMLETTDQRHEPDWALLTLFLRLPQVYPNSPGVQASSPHTLSVTLKIEHPDKRSRWPHVIAWGVIT